MRGSRRSTLSLLQLLHLYVRARMSIPRIAEELGRSKTTIRNHLTRKTKTGQLVWQTYEKFVREGVKLDLEKLIGVSSVEISRDISDQD